MTFMSAKRRVYVKVWGFPKKIAVILNEDWSRERPVRFKQRIIGARAQILPRARSSIKIAGYNMPMRHLNLPI